MDKKTKTFPIPKTIGACADLIFTLRQDRLKAQATVDAIEQHESVIREHIINTLPKSNTTGVAGKLARVTVVPKVVCQVEDWLKLYAYIKKTNAFGLLQRRVSEAPIKELWDDKKTVPGVKPFQAVTLSVNKL